MKGCFYLNHMWSFLCGICSRLDEQEALFARVQNSTCAKVRPTLCIMLGLAEWENELKCIKWNALHLLFCRSKVTLTHTRAQVFVDIWYSIFDMCGMINFVRDVIWICKDRINTQILIVLFKHHISNFGASFLHSCKHYLLFTQAWTHTTQNDIEWFRIKHSFISCIIIHCS